MVDDCGRRAGRTGAVDKVLNATTDLHDTLLRPSIHVGIVASKARLQDVCHAGREGEKGGGFGVVYRGKGSGGKRGGGMGRDGECRVGLKGGVVEKKDTGRRAQGERNRHEIGRERCRASRTLFRLKLRLRLRLRRRLRQRLRLEQHVTFYLQLARPLSQPKKSSSLSSCCYTGLANKKCK